MQQHIVEEFNTPQYKRSELFSLSLTLFFKIILATAICLIMFFTVNQVFFSLATKAIGYELFMTDVDGNTTKIVSVYYGENGEGEDDEAILHTDMTMADVRSNIVHMQKYSIRSPLSSPQMTSIFAIGQLLNLLCYLAIIYYSAFEQGQRDHTLNKYNDAPIDKNKGFKAGAIAYSPIIALYVATVVCRAFSSSEIPFKFMKLINAAFLPLYNQILRGYSNINETPLYFLIPLAIPIVITLLITGLFYRIGTRGRRDPMESVIYKTKGEE